MIGPVRWGPLRARSPVRIEEVADVAGQIFARHEVNRHISGEPKPSHFLDPFLELFGSELRNPQHLPEKLESLRYLFLVDLPLKAGRSDFGMSGDGWLLCNRSQRLRRRR